VQSVKVLV